MERIADNSRTEVWGTAITDIFFSGENSLAIKLEHPSWKCNRDFSLSILPSLPRSSFMASWHCWSLWGKFLLLGHWGLTQDWHISWPWGILGSLAFLVQSVWLCCGFRDFKSSWKYLETLKQCEVLMVLSFNFLYSGASHCLIQSEFLLLPPEARESLEAVSGQSNFSGFPNLRHQVFSKSRGF